MIILNLFKKKNCLLAGLPVSAVLLILIQPPISWHCLAWISLVPFMLCCWCKDISLKILCISAYCTGLCYWLAALYWISPITAPGWILLCMYMALIWPITAWALHWCIQKKLPLFIFGAVIFVGAERMQGWPLGGFFWRFLAHSQYSNIHCIQIADIFGAAGVSFLIALINSIIAGFIIDMYLHKLITRKNLLILITGIMSLICTYAYGYWRINQTKASTVYGPKIAAVQSNIPQSVKDSPEHAETIFNDLLRISQDTVEAGAQMIVWPETMVQAIMDKDIQTYLTPKDQEKWFKFNQALIKHTLNKAYLVIGAYGGQVKQDKKGASYLSWHNSMYLYRPDGQVSDLHYDKIHLVMFGESLPFKRSWPWLFAQMLKFTPYDYDYSMDPGDNYTKFPIHITDSNMQHKNYNFATIICYEDTIPEMARKFTLNSNGKKNIDWLVNISNDGWFVNFKDNKVIPSTELSQHTAACVFRAVENRMAILRCVNTGISCLIDPCGRLHNSYISSSKNFPAQVINRGGIAGWFMDKMPIDTRISLFSRYGQWLDNCCLTGLCIIIALSLIQGIKHNILVQSRE